MAVQEEGVNLLAFKILFLIILFFSLNIHAQNVPEIGITAGTTQYMGDINTDNPFFMPSPSAGAVFVLNLNQRTGIKTNVSYFSLKASGRDYKNQLKSFNNSYLNYNITYFVNFLEYDFSLNKHNFTPYFSLGLGYSRIFTPEGGAESHINIPLGPGIKYLIKNKVSIGFEYNLFRAFSDQVDGGSMQDYGDFLASQDNPAQDLPISNIANRDWYSYLSLVITFKFINFAADCPAY